MRRSAAVAAEMFLGISQAICAQVGADAIDRLKACSEFDGMERLKCVDELLRKMTETPDSAISYAPNWIISETTSPVDYSPQIVAATKARPSAQDAPASLAIRCGARRTQLTISTVGSLRRFKNGNRFRRFGGVTGETLGAILELRLTITFQKRTGHAAHEVDGTTLRQISGL
jgi:hypothetical protein